MGVDTDYLGHVDVVPSLNEVEREYLWRFSRSIRRYRPDSPYAVVPEDPEQDMEARNRHVFDKALAAQPNAVCQWVPCRIGCCISWNGWGRFYDGPEWMRYLIDHFLRPGGLARSSGDQQFRDFTFDHQTNGVIVGEQRDNRELFVIRVQDSEVSHEVLRAGDRMWWQDPSAGPEPPGTTLAPALSLAGTKSNRRPRGPRRASPAEKGR